MTDTQTPQSREFDEAVFLELRQKVGLAKAEKTLAEEKLREATAEACDYLARHGGQAAFTDTDGERRLARRRQDQQTTWSGVKEIHDRIGKDHPELFKISVDGRALERAAKKDPKILQEFRGHFTISPKSAWLEIVPLKEDA